MSNYLDNLDVIDANGNPTNVLLKDRGTSALATSILTRLNNATIYNVKQYGVIGDGNTDDTSALQALVDNVTSGIIYFPKGEYKITDSINVDNSYITFIGQGKINSVIRTDQNIDIFIVNAAYEVNFINLDFRHSGVGDSIKYVHGETSLVEKCYFEHTNNSNNKYCIEFYESNMFITQCAFDVKNTSAYGIKVSINIDGININSKIIGNYFGWTGSGILVTSEAADDFRVEGLLIAENTFICQGTEQIGLFTAFDIEISNNMFDQGGNNCIAGTSTGVLGLTSVRIFNNYISAYVNEYSTGINITGVYGLMINDNKFSFDGNGVVLSGCSDVMIDNNMFTDIRHTAIQSAQTIKCTIANNTFGNNTNYGIDLADNGIGNYLLSDNDFGTSLISITKTSNTNFVVDVNKGLGEIITTSKTIAVTADGNFAENIDLPIARQIYIDSIMLTLNTTNCTSDISNLQIIGNPTINSIQVKYTVANYTADTAFKINVMARMYD